MTTTMKTDDRGDAPMRCGSSAVSIMQHWLLHLVQLNPAAPTHTTVVVELIGRLRRRSLRAALDDVVCRHRILRTVFWREQGAWRSISGPVDQGLALLEQNVGTEREAVCALHNETQVPFDVSIGPLIRARLLQLEMSRHFLAISVHPVISDSASLASLLKELGTLYVGSSLDKKRMLPPVGQYADHAAYQLQTCTPRVLQEQLSYWRRQLLGAKDLVHLRTDRLRPATQTYSARKHRLKLSEELTADLIHLAERRSVSLLVVLLAGWTVVLNRWSGQRDVTVGVLVSSRPLAHDALIGPLENILPIRVNISPSTTVATLLVQLDTALSAAKANQDLPIHAIDESLRPLRDGRPIIQTAISLSQASLDSVARAAFWSGELEVGRVSEERWKSTLEIGLAVSLTGGRLVAVLEYATELFDEGTVERARGWWTTVLSAMVKAPRSKVSRLPILNEDGRETVIKEFGSGRCAFLQPRRIDDMFEGYVDLAPDAPAAVDGANGLSFLELNGRANQLARLLKRRGARAGELVAVLLEPGLEAIVATIAVLKAGCAYVAGAPVELRGGILGSLRDRAPRMLIVARRKEIAPRIGNESIVALDVDRGAIERESIENLQREETSACDLACAVLSVGRAGRRRWMLIEHRNVTSMVLSLDERLHFTRFDVWALAHSMLSRIGLMELWGALLSGSQAAVVPTGETMDPTSLCRFLEQGRITVLNQEPSEFLRWADVAVLSPRHQLHSVILSGESLRAAELKPWFKLGRRWPQVVYLCGHHWLTIAGAYSEFRQLDLQRKSAAWLAGAPLSCVRIYILDVHRQPVPIGVLGEIYIAGEGVARGYIQTCKRAEHVPDPFSTDPNEKIYRTGDRGYWTAEGQVEIVLAASSADVEAARVECELLSHPDVRRASVVSCPGETGANSYMAYAEGIRRAPTPAELRTFLELNVPAYMVPFRYVCQARTPPDATSGR